MVQFQWMGRIIFATLASLALVLLFVWKQPQLRSVPLAVPTISRGPSGKSAAKSPIVACRGPRGGRLNDIGSQDLPTPLHSLNNISHPNPTTGSYDEIGLEKTWLSFEQRYGPYGYGEQEDSYAFPLVDWEMTDWGKLQTDCLRDNQHDHGAFNETGGASAATRFRLHGSGPEFVPSTSKTGRQAIVLRTWSTYEYKDEDLWNIRSIITEASLATGSK